MLHFVAVIRCVLVNVGKSIIQHFHCLHCTYCLSQHSLMSSTIWFAGANSEVPLYGMAACQRCLEEFDTLLELSDFQSPTWSPRAKLFDLSRVANMLLAQGDRDDGAALPWANGALPTNGDTLCSLVP